jgi:hypothetical protein
MQIQVNPMLIDGQPHLAIIAQDGDSCVFEYRLNDGTRPEAELIKSGISDAIDGLARFKQRCNQMRNHE